MESFVVAKQSTLFSFCVFVFACVRVCGVGGSKSREKKEERKVIVYSEVSNLHAASFGREGGGK